MVCMGLPNTPLAAHVLSEVYATILPASCMRTKPVPPSSSKPRRRLEASPPARLMSWPACCMGLMVRQSPASFRPRRPPSCSSSSTHTAPPAWRPSDPTSPALTTMSSCCLPPAFASSSLSNPTRRCCSTLTCCSCEAFSPYWSPCVPPQPPSSSTSPILSRARFVSRLKLRTWRRCMQCCNRTLTLYPPPRCPNRQTANGGRKTPSSSTFSQGDLQTRCALSVRSWRFASHQRLVALLVGCPGGGAGGDPPLAQRSW
mmetsp:Transcript_7856/g.17587  ORF Transcript_7856/g.17587 Transcript_7856/m.17587 type:complete len:258 (+) Transcript_7856:171-944(+)